MASIVSNRVFHSLYKVGRNGNFVFKGFNNSKKELPPVGLDLVQEIIVGLGVQCLSGCFWKVAGTSDWYFVIL